MPRKATDKVIEHRITLGDLERGELRKIVRAETIRDYGQMAQGFGIVGAGAAAIFGAYVFMKIKAPDIPLIIKELPRKIIDEIVEVATPILDDSVDWAAKGNPIEHRRTAQELAKRRGDLYKDIAVFCTASSEKYDEATCTQLNTVDKRQYFQDLKAFQDMISSTYNETSTTHLFSMRAFIYKGLGDINPDYER